MDLGTRRPWSLGRKIWTVVGGGGVLAIVLAIAIPELLSPTCVITFEHSLRGQLWYVQQAQRVYRSEVPRPPDEPLFFMPKYWHKDVAGLYTFKRMSLEERCLDAGMALADDRPLTDLTAVGPRGSYSGYWFRQIRPGKENDPEGDHFAICVFPAEYRNGSRLTFLVSDDGLYEKDLGRGGGIEAAPGDPLQDGWRSASR